MFLSHLSRIDSKEPGGFKILGPSGKLWPELVKRYDGKEFYFYYTPVFNRDTAKMIWFYENQILPKIHVLTGMGSNTHLYCTEEFGFGFDVSKYTFDQLHLYIETLKEFFDL